MSHNRDCEQDGLKSGASSEYAPNRYFLSEMCHVIGCSGTAAYA